MDENILSTLAELRTNDALTDCRIDGFTVEEPPEWRVHRLVLAMHSNDLLERCTKVLETSEYRLDLNSWREGVLDRLVSWMYTLDYGTEEQSISCVNIFVWTLDEHLIRPFNRLHISIEMYQLPEDQGIPHFKTKAKEKFAAEFTTWNLTALQRNSAFIEDLVDAVYDNDWSNALGEALVKHPLDIGACGREIPIRGDLLSLAARYPDYGTHLIDQLGRRTGGH